MEVDRDDDDVTFTDLDIGGAAPPLPPQAPPLPSGLPPMMPGAGPKPLPFPGAFFNQRPMQMHSAAAAHNHDQLVQAFKDLLLEVKVALPAPMLGISTFTSKPQPCCTLHIQ